MASLILRQKPQTLIPKSHQSTLIFNRCFSSSNSSDNDGNAPVNSQQSPPKGASIEQIRKSLSVFRRPSPVNRTPISSIDQIADINPNPNPNPNAFSSFAKGGNLSFERIKGSLQKMGESKPVNNLNNFKESFRMNPTTPKGNVIGRSIDNSPNVFEKGMKENTMDKLGEEDRLKYDLVRVYTFDELGQKLKELRPDATATLGIEKEKDGLFSLSELQQRLGKLKEMETKEPIAGGVMQHIRQSLKSMLTKDDKTYNEKLDLLSQPGFMTSPPKDHLVEKYFHPDNMSSAEKLKIKLKKVRDEFKMSDSDCGSTRVQIAQLTTEIHHLSSVLHKKDKHSRRGLHLKVQQRKKLLKYLRRTDWDSYCLVLSKLGLRDNPDYKN